MPSLVETSVPYKIGCEMCSRSKLLIVHLLQSWAMDLSLPGVMPAFAAILGDGSVVNWGNADYGGDSSAVQDQLKSVQQIQSSGGTFGGAFAAILRDGSVDRNVYLMRTAFNLNLKVRSFSRLFTTVNKDHLLLSWMMELWSPGAKPAMEATAVPSRSS